MLNDAQEAVKLCHAQNHNVCLSPDQTELVPAPTEVCRNSCLACGTVIRYVMTALGKPSNILLAMKPNHKLLLRNNGVSQGNIKPSRAPKLLLPNN